MTPTPTNESSPASPSTNHEAPLLSKEVNQVDPNETKLDRPPKPLIEMTDEELQSWHAKLRETRLSHPTLVSHLAKTAPREKGQPKQKLDLSEYQ